MMRVARRGHPAIDDMVADGEDRRREPIVIARNNGVLADRIGQLAQDGRTQVTMLIGGRRPNRLMVRRGSAVLRTTGVAFAIAVGPIEIE